MSIKINIADWNVQLFFVSTYFTSYLLYPYIYLPVFSFNYLKKKLPVKTKKAFIV